MYYPYIDKYQLYENLHIYILLFIFITIVSIFVCIKLSFPFWNIQPVYHSYDFWRTLYSNPFILHKRFSTKLLLNKYCDLKNIETIQYIDASEDSHKKPFVDFLQCFHLYSENSIFVFTIENLNAYFSGHLYSTYLSFYYIHDSTNMNDKLQLTYNQKEQNGKINACISSRSGELIINEHYNDTININTMPIYFIDFLCIHRNLKIKEKTKISRTLFQTHIYKQQCMDNMDNSRHINTKVSIRVYLFRKERELLYGIVPLTRCKTSYYEMANVRSMRLKSFPEHFVLLEINSANFDLLIDFLYVIKNRFSIFIKTDVSNILELIKAEILHVYCLKCMDDIYSMYFFRDSRSNYEGLGSVLELVASIHNSSSQELFINGCLHSISNIVKKMPVYKVLMVDEISDNSIITCKHNQINEKKIYEYWSAYYLYNMVIPWTPISGSRVFILF